MILPNAFKSKRKTILKGTWRLPMMTSSSESQLTWPWQSCWSSGFSSLRLVPWTSMQIKSEITNQLVLGEGQQRQLLYYSVDFSIEGCWVGGWQGRLHIVYGQICLKGPSRKIMKHGERYQLKNGPSPSHPLIFRHRIPPVISHDWIFIERPVGF